MAEPNSGKENDENVRITRSLWLIMGVGLLALGISTYAVPSLISAKDLGNASIGAGVTVLVTEVLTRSERHHHRRLLMEIKKLEAQVEMQGRIIKEGMDENLVMLEKVNNALESKKAITGDVGPSGLAAQPLDGASGKKSVPLARIGRSGDLPQRNPDELMELYARIPKGPVEGSETRPPRSVDEKLRGFYFLSRDILSLLTEQDESRKRQLNNHLQTALEDFGDSLVKFPQKMFEILKQDSISKPDKEMLLQYLVGFSNRTGDVVGPRSRSALLLGANVTYIDYKTSRGHVLSPGDRKDFSVNASTALPGRAAALIKQLEDAGGDGIRIREWVHWIDDIFENQNVKG